ncbi:MAG: TetR/AcrR family transcriptional regulator [Erythrobacter sp.]|nr:TetR/AcrR family transcriptional regulator [Erythrobacter sp.]
MEVSSREDTKTELLRSAERLIAEKGLGSVSVKMITTDAGARNASAVHYHFGSIESLIEEVFAKRYREIEAERASRLERVTEADPQARLVALVEAAIGPFLEACLEDNGRVYARFCLQFVSDPRFDYPKLIMNAGAQTFVRLSEEIIACLPQIPLAMLEPRMRQSFVIAMVQAVSFARAVEAGTAAPIEAAVREAAICQAAYLSAPA